VSLAALLNQPVTVERRPGHLEEPTVTFDVRAYLEPLNETEVLDGQETYVTTWRVFLPVGTEMDAADTILLGDGRRLEVVSALSLYNPLRRRAAHVECRCKEVDG
jgi:hypothetical protein